MAQQFRAQLVIAQAKVRTIASRSEVIASVKATGVAECQLALLGDERVRLKLADFEVQPPRAEQIVEPDKICQEMKVAIVVQSRLQREGDILVQGAGGPDVEALDVESRSCDLRLGLSVGGIAGSHVNRNAIAGFPIPCRHRAECNRKVRSLLIDGGVAAGHQLVAIILERLAKIVELGPSLVTIGTPQVVLSGESRDTERGCSRTQQCEPDYPSDPGPSSYATHALLQMALLPNRKQQRRPVQQ